MKKRQKPKEYWPFSKAKDFARASGLKCQREWENYISKTKHPSLPASPSSVYKHSGWVSWMDWLGTDNRAGYPSRRKYFVNNAFFDSWSPDMAYVLGFWFADGWIGKQNCFGITQHKNDKYILENILKAMRSNYPLRSNKRHNCLTFEIRSKEIVKAIKKLGGVERKSLTVRFPNVPNKYLPDFVRGLWDGDGCIAYAKFRKCYVSSYVSGSGSFVRRFLKTLQQKILGLNGTIYVARANLYRKHNLYSIIFSRNDTVRLRAYMYGKAKSKLMLTRKAEKFNKAGEIKKIGREFREFLSFAEARKFIRKQHLGTVEEWMAFSKTRRPSNIPSTPQQYYKKWTNWYDFLGKQKKEI